MKYDAQDKEIQPENSSETSEIKNHVQDKLEPAAEEAESHIITDELKPLLESFTEQKEQCLGTYIEPDVEQEVEPDVEQEMERDLEPDVEQEMEPEREYRTFITKCYQCGSDCVFSQMCGICMRTLSFP